MYRLVGLAILALAVAGCGKSTNPDKVTYVADDDPRMNAAIAKAKSTVNTFIAALKSPKPGQSDFAIKMPMVDGKNVEHMWLTPVTFDGTNFHGTLDNTPEKVKNVKLGQEMVVDPSKISDWMYVDNGKLIGGHTLRVLRETLSPSERKEFDKSMPFKID